MVGPLRVNRVRSSRCVLRFALHRMEEQLVGAAASSQVAAIEGPIQSHDKGGVSLEFVVVLVSPRLIRIVHIDEVVVGADCQFGAIWRILHTLDPLFRLSFDVRDFVKFDKVRSAGCRIFNARNLSNGDAPVIVPHSQVVQLCVVAESTRLQMRVHLRLRTGSTSHLFLLHFGQICNSLHFSFANDFSLAHIIQIEHVVVA